MKIALVQQHAERDREKNIERGLAVLEEAAGAGVFAALANRVGREDCLDFAGESYVAGPDGRILARAPAGEDHILYCDLDLSEVETSNARRFFLPSRRPDIYTDL